MADSERGTPPARTAFIGIGITFFMVGVVFTLTMPDNIALGITFLVLGVVFFSMSSGRRDGGGGGASADRDEPDSDAQT